MNEPLGLPQSEPFSEIEPQAIAGPDLAAGSPEPVARAAAMAEASARGPRRPGGVGRLFAASLLSAALASGLTVALVPRSTSSTGATAAASSSTSANVTVASTTTSSAASIAAADGPAVVTIQTTSSSTGQWPGSQSGSGVGSGFIYESDGYILTAAHVVEGASQVTVALADGRTFPGTVVSSDTALDVAVVKISATGLPTLALATSTSAELGQTVLAIGDPLGEFPGSVTTGIVSGTDRSITVADDLTGQGHDLSGLIQTDAAINPGNSGGPLVDSTGAVIGIINASSSSAEGIGFAIPISAAAGVMASARTV
jgi:serine protease Do